MVTSIGSTGLAQPLLARVASRTAAAPQETAAASVTPAQDAQAGTASAPSAESAATARVGDQLDAQFDAARVRRAQDDMPPPPEGAPPLGDAVPPEGPPPLDDAGADATAAAAGADTTEGATEAATEAAPAGGGAGGSASASSDYIAEADTNQDRKLSEEERIAYEKKQASEAQGKVEQSRAQEVQQAYLPQDSAGTQLDVEA